MGLASLAGLAWLAGLASAAGLGASAVGLAWLAGLAWPVGLQASRGDRFPSRRASRAERRSRPRSSASCRASRRGRGPRMGASLRRRTTWTGCRRLRPESCRRPPAEYRRGRSALAPARCARSCPAHEVSNKGLRACLGRVARLTSTWALTWTAVVEVGVAVVVEPIVDLDVDLRLRSSGTVGRVARGQGARPTMGSTSNVAVNVKVLRQRHRRGQRRRAESASVLLDRHRVRLSWPAADRGGSHGSAPMRTRSRSRPARS